MPTTRSFTSSYAGDAIRSYILKCISGGETASTAGLKIETGVKYKRTIKKLTSSGILQSGGCDFNPTGTYTITEGVLEPQKIKVNGQLCFEDFYALWDSESMADGMNNEDAPAELISAMTEEIVGRVAEGIEVMIWQGSTTDTGATGINTLIDGYEALLDAGSPVIVSGSSITGASNVVTELNKVTAAQPECIMSKPANTKVMFTSPLIAEYYQQNLAAQGVRTTIDEQPLAFHGIELRAVPGISAGKVVLTQRDNFYIGTDLESDFNELKFIDQRDIDGSDYINFVLKGKIDVAIGWTSEVVYYLGA